MEERSARQDVKGDRCTAEDVKARVQVDSMLSRLFSLKVGVRQGSALFNLFINDLIKS